MSWSRHAIQACEALDKLALPDMRLSMTLSCRLDRTSAAVITFQQQSSGSAQQLHEDQYFPKKASIFYTLLQHKVRHLIQVNKALRRKLHTASSTLRIQASVLSAQAKHQAIDWALAAQQQAAHALIAAAISTVSCKQPQGSC